MRWEVGRGGVDLGVLQYGVGRQMWVASERQEGWAGLISVR